MMMARIWMAAALLGLVGGAAAPAAADEERPQVMTLEEVKRCLCQERDMDRRRAEIDSMQGALTVRRAELAGLNREIARVRATTSPSDATAQAYLARLLARQQQMWGPEYQQTWAPYNRNLVALSLASE